MKTAFVPLNRLLPQTDVPMARLRSCVRGVRQRLGPVASSGARFQLDMGPECPVEADALLAVVGTPAGSARLAFSPDEWPALTSAATLVDRRQRAAVALLLLGDTVGSLAGMLSSVEIQPSVSVGLRTSGIVLRWAEQRLHVVQADEGVLDVVRAWSGRLVPALQPGADAFRIPSVLSLGRRCIPCARLRLLRDGDTVLLPAFAGAEALQPALTTAITMARLSWGDTSSGGLHTRVSLHHSTMTLIDAPSDNSAADLMDEPAVSASESASTTRLALARLELQLQFELAGPVLRLADIAGLAAGDVLELPVPVEHARVRITVARQWVGIGELVAVGGQVGVRIVRIDLADFQEAAP
jgi:type III secretion protein Q